MANMNSSISKGKQRQNNLELLERLTNKTRARQLWKKYGLNELLLVRETLQEAIDIAELEQMEIEELQKKKLELRESVEVMLKEQGMTLKELVNDEVPTAAIIRRKKRGSYKARGSVPLKFKCQWKGQDWYWNGNNKTPDIFKCVFIEQGLPKRAFKLKESEYIHNATKEQRNLKIPPEYIDEVRQIIGKEPVDV